MPTVQSIVRQALGVVIGGLIVAAMTLAPRANAQEQLTVTSLNGPLSIDETYDTDKRITYQGMLLDALGQPVPNGSYYMVFSIYDSATSTQPLWQQEFNPNANTGVNVTGGYFTVLLDVNKDGTADSTIFTGDGRWLGVRVRNDPEMTPRQPLLYVPYAYWARNADKLGGKGSHYLPVVFGIVDGNGSRLKGDGFSSSRRNDGAYIIDIAGVNYDLNHYVTVVTPISQGSCPFSTIALTNSYENKLLVDLRDARNENVAGCKFHFVTYKP